MSDVQALFELVKGRLVPELESDFLKIPLPVLDLSRPYSRSVIGLSERCEVMLARWNPRLECAPHDHGKSGGYVLYLAGEFVETQYARVAGGLKPAGRRAISAGTLIHIEPGEIHSCHSLGEGISLHVYSPPIDGMQVYDLDKKELLTVCSAAGAWCPQPENMVISRSAL